MSEYARGFMACLSLTLILLFATGMIRIKNQSAPHRQTKNTEFTAKELEYRERVSQLETKAPYYSQLGIRHNDAAGGYIIAGKQPTTTEAITIPPGISVTLHRNNMVAVCSRDENRYVLLFHVNGWWYKIVTRDESGNLTTEQERSQRAEENREGDLERALESLIDY